MQVVLPKRILDIAKASARSYKSRGYAVQGLAGTIGTAMNLRRRAGLDEAWAASWWTQLVDEGALKTPEKTLLVVLAATDMPLRDLAAALNRARILGVKVLLIDLVRRGKAEPILDDEAENTEAMEA